MLRGEPPWENVTTGGTPVNGNHSLRWLATALLALAWAPAAQAFSGGIATTSFPVPAQACNFCHGGGTTPTVTLACVDCGGGPPVVLPLSTHEFKLTVVEVGLQNHAGLNVSSPDGTLALGGGASANTRTITGTGGRAEITHTAPKAAAGGMTEFSFLWTAPASGSATLTGWGNAVNFTGSTAGDAASSAALVVSISGDTPTPTDTPTATPEPPTPTPTPLGGCPLAVDGGCATGFAKGLLKMSAAAGKEKLVAKLLKGPALAQTDLGNPLDVGQGGTGTSYSLCVYDQSGVLAGGVEVDRAGDTCDGQPCWKPLGHAPNDPRGPGKGYKYKDGAAAADGVRKLLYKGGDAGSSKAIVVGKGSALPVGLPAALQSATQATLQLRSSDGICVSVDLTDISEQTATSFKAKE